MALSGSLPSTTAEPTTQTNYTTPHLVRFDGNGPQHPRAPVIIHSRLKALANKLVDQKVHTCDVVLMGAQAIAVGATVVYPPFIVLRAQPIRSSICDLQIFQAEPRHRLKTPPRARNSTFLKNPYR